MQGSRDAFQVVGCIFSAGLHPEEEGHGLLRSLISFPLIAFFLKSQLPVPVHKLANCLKALDISTYCMKYSTHV